ncbi:MAG: DUF2513 domain-containing protein [Opitutales bacterium]
MDLIRDLLLYAEEHDRWPLDGYDIAADTEEIALDIGVNLIVLYRHTKLLEEAGFVRGIDTSTLRSYGWEFKEITWAGYDFLDATRSQEVWEKVKSKALKAGGWTFSLLVEMGKEELKRRLLPD